MPIQGKGFLGLWHDIEASAEPDYHQWHTLEHMPERVSLPGFLRARRGVNWEHQHQRYLTVYEGAELEAFRSPEYLERLNKPTAWSSKMAPSFRNFLRVACETVSTVGIGAGGAMTTARVNFSDGMDEAGLKACTGGLTRALMELPGIAGVHVAIARPEYSSVTTTETKLRPEMAEPGFDAVVLVDGVGLPELKALDGRIRAALDGAGLGGARVDHFDIAYTLSPDGGS